MISRVILLVILLQFHAACAPVTAPLTVEQAELDIQKNARTAKMDAKLKQLDGMTADQLVAFYKNKTQVAYEPRHGTQIEYTSADGRAYLWYPGNKVILPGEWKRRDQPGHHKIPANTQDGKIFVIPKTEMCFRYGDNSYNPVTGQRGGNFECSPIALAILLSEKAIVDGDIFDLAGRNTVPFVLPGKTQLSMADVEKRVASGS